MDYYMRTRDTLVAVRMKQYMITSWGRRSSRLTAIHMNDLACGKGSVTACESLGRGAWQVGNDRISGIVLSGGFDPERSPVLLERDWDFILLSGEPRFNFSVKNRLLSRADVIVDGSNRAWFSAQLDPSSGARFSARPGSSGESLYVTGQRGAYVRRW